MVRFRFLGSILFAIISFGHTCQYDDYYSSSNREDGDIKVIDSIDLKQTWFVNDTASAGLMAEAVNCSGGTFDVTWQGSVLVERPIYISGGTTLYVTGEGSGAEINGGGMTRLFKAVDAYLHIEGMTLSNGNASYGGAIAATRSDVFLYQTSCIGNIASSYGGAIYVGKSSTLVWEGQALLTGNHAGQGGGALVADDASTVFWSGTADFTFNTAGDPNADGGAVYVNNRSRVSWDGMTSFVNNMASNGGALYVNDHSDVSWNGIMYVSKNKCSLRGGAIRIASNSKGSWDGVASFSYNNASTHGGAFDVYDNSVVRWNGATSFFNNTAPYGGALYAHRSTISWDGNTSFAGNNAEKNGGAVRCYDDSVVSWAGNTSYVNNTAFYGAALSVSNHSTTWWEGVTSFFGNQASSHGGAFDLYHNNIMWWSGVTSFVNNAASYGGAVFVRQSNVSWEGVTSFIDNDARTGGALRAYENSILSWGGNTTFVNNKSQGRGGALGISLYCSILWEGVTSFFGNNASSHGGALDIYDNSIVKWDGLTSFVNNTAPFGGALFAYHSNISWNGEARFVGNSAVEYGGALRSFFNCFVSWNGSTSFIENTAIYGGALGVSLSSRVTVGGDTRFLGNHAAVDGGAVYAYVSDDAMSLFVVENTSIVLFEGNSCGANGGAIAFIGGVITSFPPNVTFSANTAGVSGGAISLAGVTVGMRFEGTRFISNSALIGGGIFSTGSGTAVTGKFDHEYNPTLINGCEFIENKALKTGGAIDSGAGRETITNTSFVRNTASIGGALRLVGTTSLVGCDFIENVSGEDEGPGVSNDGVISVISDCSFADNTFNCPTRYFLDCNNTDALFATICKGCDTQCSNCSLGGKEPRCLEELEHSSSTGGNTKLESLQIKPGYWRSTNRSLDIKACYNQQACLGGLTREDGYCREGYEGPYCSVCSKNYSASFGFVCEKCFNNATGSIILGVVIGVGLLFVFIFFLSFMLSGETENMDRRIVARVTRYIPLQSIKIIIVVWQILTQFSTVANVVFPNIYQTFLDGVDFLNFDLSWVLAAGCIIDTDFHDQLLLSTVGPFLFIVILGGTFVVAMRKYCTSEEARGVVRRKHMSMVLFLTFLVYSSVSSTVFQTFACDSQDDGKIYLRADYRIECDSPKHTVLEMYAGLMIIVYVIGIPAFYSVLLYKNREALTDIVARERDDRIKPITYIWKPYRSDRLYYEVIECLRRVLLTGALVFIYPNTAAQIAVALMMATFFIFVSEALAPYESPWDTWCSRAGHAIIFLSMFLALLQKVDVSRDCTSSRSVFGSVLIAAHFLLVLLVLIEAVAMIVVWRHEMIEETQHRVKSSYSTVSSVVGNTEGVLEEDQASSDPEIVVENTWVFNPAADQ